MKLFMTFLLLFFTGNFAIAEPIAAQELVERIDNLYRLDSSYAVVSMTIETPDWQRSMTMEMWTKGQDYALIRITSPAKEKGVSTLKRGKEMWNYFPKIDKEIKVAPSMMMGSWMGSDFTNDDLVREISLMEEYFVELQIHESTYLLTLKPKAQTITVWGEIRIEIDQENLLPIREVYFDEDGTAMREMRFHQVTNFDGRLLPKIMELIPLNKKNQKTTLIYNELRFSEDWSDNLFSLRNLKRVR